MSAHADRLELAAVGRRRLKQPRGRQPLVLPSAQIRRMRDRGPSILILSRSLDVGLYTVHDESVVQKNWRNRRDGHPELQDEPAAFMIEIAPSVTLQLAELDDEHLAAAAFADFEDFYIEWLSRRRRFVARLELQLYPFQIAATARYLHQKVHRGYTNDPAQAIPDEPEVIDDELLAQFADEGRARYAAENAEALAKRAAASRARRLKELQAIAVRQGVDIGGEVEAVDTVLEQIESKLGVAA